ncbi:SEC-C metal-binding domain-containing protein [Aeromonas veronii]|uniref:SEC-C metal-binding domain-containing protein n=1 Tax=Aeromonas veronii TaxID=654 RepID=UPI003D242487
MRKTGRNEPCWCGSGQKYKKCHLNRSTEETLSINRLIAELKSKTFHKECMHLMALAARTSLTPIQFKRKVR